MSLFCYATFDEYGRCLTIIRSAIELDLPHTVENRTKPEDIYLNNGEVFLRKQITISVDRDYCIADGIDSPIVSGLPDGGILLANHIVNGATTSKIVGAMMIEATGEYRSNEICVMFEPLEAIAARFLVKVDEAAGIARKRHVTNIPGQQAIYAAKRAEAEAWLERAPGNYPYLAAEAVTTEYDDMDALARTILARAMETDQALASIEALRMGAKQAISTATDAATICAAANITWP